MGQYKKILRILAACLSMVLFFSALSLSAGAWEAPDWRRYGYMVDVPEDEADWRYDGIYWCVGNGVMTGKNQREFAPNDPMTRAEFMQVMYSLMTNLERDMTVDEEASLPFTDIETAWYTPALRWCYQNGIVNGVTETTMEPNSPVTRGQMAQMLYVIITKYFGVDLTDEIAQVDLNTTYVDGAVIPQWVQTQARAVTGTGLYVGSDGYFNADNHASRSEIAAIAKRLYTYYSSTWECYLGDLELVPTMFEEFESDDPDDRYAWRDDVWFGPTPESNAAETEKKYWQLDAEDRLFTEDGYLWMRGAYPEHYENGDVDGDGVDDGINYSNGITGLATTTDAEHKFSQAYGYYEIRLKPSNAAGMLSTFWNNTIGGTALNHEDPQEDPFVEMDFFEALPQLVENMGAYNENRGKFFSTLHWNTTAEPGVYQSDQWYTQGSIMKRGKLRLNEDGTPVVDEDGNPQYTPYAIPTNSMFDGEFHTVGFLWTKEGYSVYYDGNLVGEFPEAPMTNRDAVLRVNAYYADDTWRPIGNLIWSDPEQFGMTEEEVRASYDDVYNSAYIIDYVHVYQLADYVEEYPPNWHGQEGSVS